MIAYLFGRVADEVFDSQCEPSRKKRLWELYQRFLDELFADRKSDFDVNRTPREAKIDWAPYERELTDEKIAIFRALARIAYYLPAKPFYEMFEAGRWDLEGKTIQSLDDLKLYSYLVSGSNAALCVYATIYRDYNDEYYDLVEKGTDDELVKRAYQMGEVSLIFYSFQFFFYRPSNDNDRSICIVCDIYVTIRTKRYMSFKHYAQRFHFMASSTDLRRRIL